MYTDILLRVCEISWCIFLYFFSYYHYLVNESCTYNLHNRIGLHLTIDPGVDGLKYLRLTPKLFDWLVDASHFLPMLGWLSKV